MSIATVNSAANILYWNKKLLEVNPGLKEIHPANPQAWTIETCKLAICHSVTDLFRSLSHV